MRGAETGSLWSDGSPWVQRVFLVRRLFARMRGLLGTRELPPGMGLLLDPCGSVHTFGMRYTLDLVFIGRGWHVLGCRRGLAPWRCAAAPRGTRRVLETAHGWLDIESCAVGSRLEWKAESIESGREGSTP